MQLLPVLKTQVLLLQQIARTTFSPSGPVQLARSLHLARTSPTRLFSTSASAMGSIAPPSLVNAGVQDAPFYLPRTDPSPGTALSSDLFPVNKDLPLLFRPISIGGLEFKNRIQVAPMCQYSALDGVPTPWHLVHLGGFATRGASLVIAEATGVLPVSFA